MLRQGEVNSGADAAMRCYYAYLAVFVVCHVMFSSTLVVGEDVAFLPSRHTAESLESRRTNIVQHINTLLREQWEQAGVRPTVLASDGKFLRRAYLDLNGVIPRVSEVHEFLADDRPDKRQRLVERLLASPRYATHMATVWRNRILPPGSEEMHVRESLGLQKWLRTRFAKNLRYDALVAGLLLATGGEELGPGLYFQANDLQPEKMAASVSELFLGVQLQCAQCHDHPHADWSQKDFWGMAAFFCSGASTRGPRNEHVVSTYRCAPGRSTVTRFGGSSRAEVSVWRGGS